MGSEREEGLERQSQGGGCSERALQRLSGRTGCAGRRWAGGGRLSRAAAWLTLGASYCRQFYL